MEKELISIIVPVYNVEKYVIDCLNSIINQTYKNLDIIIIDDGSTDNSGKICDDYAAKDKRITVFHIKNGGVSNARNIGLKYAKGNYIGFVDSDDTIENCMFETLYNNMIKNNVDISMCNYNFIAKDEKHYRKHNISNNLFLIKDKDTFFRLLNKNYYKGFLWNKLFKKEQIGNILLDEEIYMCEDLVFVCQVAQRCSSFCFDNKGLYNYTIRKGSAYNSKINDKHITVIKAFDKILNIVKVEAKNDVYYEYMNEKFSWLNEICKSYKFKDKNMQVKFNKLNKELYKQVIKEKCLKEYRLEDFIKYRFYNIFAILKKIKYFLK